MKKLHNTIVFAALFFIMNICAQAQPAEFAVKLNRNAGITVLNTEYDIYFDTLFTTLKTAGNLPEPLKIKVPSTWNKTYSQFNPEKGAYGYATYRLMLTGLSPHVRYAFFIRRSPASACNFYADGKLIYSAGTVSAVKETAKPAYKPIYAEFAAGADGTAELVVQVSNWVYRKGGLWTSVFFGEQDDIYRYYNTSAGIIFFICALLFFLCIVSFTVYVLNPRKRAPLYFTLFLVSLILRMSVNAFNIISLIFPAFSYSLLFKLEYAVLWIAAPAFLYFLSSMFPCSVRFKLLRNAYGIVQFAIMIAGFALPISIVNRLIPFFQITTVIGSVFCSVILISACRKKEKQAFFYLLSFLVLILAVAHEMVTLNLFGIVLYSFLPLSFLLLAVIQFFTFTARENALVADRIMLIHKLKKLNDAYMRFVPYDFFKLLNKNNIIEVGLGDHIQQEMGILFAHITIGGEENQVSLEEQYDVFSAFSMIVSSVVSQHNGFVSKFISKGGIALFPNGTQDALDCSFEIHRKIEKLNVIRQNAGRPALSLGMGIHYGSMILGTIGEISRLDDTVISDTVNTASRIESVSECLKYSILISLEAVEKSDLAKRTDIALIPLGNMRVKGRVNLVLLFKCLPLTFLHEQSLTEEHKDGVLNDLEEQLDEI